MEIRTPDMLTSEQRAQMLEKIIDHFGFKSQAEFARHIGISPQNINSWRTRGTYNVELLAVRFPELSGDWLLTGEGPMLKAERGPAPAETVRPAPAETARPAPATHSDLKRVLNALVTEQRMTEQAVANTEKVMSVLKTLSAAVEKLLANNNDELPF